MTEDMTNIAETVNSITSHCGRQTMRNNVEADFTKQSGGRLCETKWRKAM